MEPRIYSSTVYSFVSSREFALFFFYSSVVSSSRKLSLLKFRIYSQIPRNFWIFSSILDYCDFLFSFSSPRRFWSCGYLSDDLIIIFSSFLVRPWWSISWWWGAGDEHIEEVLGGFEVGTAFSSRWGGVDVEDVVQGGVVNWKGASWIPQWDEVLVGLGLCYSLGY